MVVRKNAKKKNSYDSNNRMEPEMQWEITDSIFYYSVIFRFGWYHGQLAACSY